MAQEDRTTSQPPANITYLHIYRAPDDEIEVHMVDGELWLSQKAMAVLFGVSAPTINEHINNVMSEDGLDDSTIRKIRIVQSEGNREVSRIVQHYNLDVIIPVGYRVNSSEAGRFRRWANGVLRDYLVKGAALNPQRLESLDLDSLQNVAQSSIRAIVAAYRKQGFGDEKIRERLGGMVSRNDMTDALKSYVTGKVLYGHFTNQTYIGLFSRDADQLKRENGGLKPRDGMTAQGLSLLSTAEATVSDMLKDRPFVTYFEALAILEKVCRQIEPSIQGLQRLLGVDLGTGNPLLPGPQKDGAA